VDVWPDSLAFGRGRVGVLAQTISGANQPIRRILHSHQSDCAALAGALATDGVQFGLDHSDGEAVGTASAACRAHASLQPDESPDGGVGRHGVAGSLILCNRSPW
jgi:hypothetical protein